jgi:hypothetical protein
MNPSPRPRTHAHTPHTQAPANATPRRQHPNPRATPTHAPAPAPAPAQHAALVTAVPPGLTRPAWARAPTLVAPSGRECALRVPHQLPLLSSPHPIPSQAWRDLSPFSGSACACASGRPRDGAAPLIAAGAWWWWFPPSPPTRTLLNQQVHGGAVHTQGPGRLQHNPLRATADGYGLGGCRGGVRPGKAAAACAEGGRERGRGQPPAWEIRRVNPHGPTRTRRRRGERRGLCTCKYSVRTCVRALCACMRAHGSCTHSGRSRAEHPLVTGATRTERHGTPCVAHRACGARRRQGQCLCHRVGVHCARQRPDYHATHPASWPPPLVAHR